MGVKPRVRRLSTEDLSILALENETVAGHACKVVVLDGGIELDRLRASILGRLDRAPELCMRLCYAEGESAFWVPDSELDICAHVVLREDAEVRDGPGFRAWVARVFEQRLDRSGPLWCIDVIPSMPGGGAALIWRIHHALADGLTAMRMAEAVLWDERPDAEATTDARMFAADLRRATHRRLGVARSAAREVPQPWRRSPFQGHVGARRAVAFATAELDGMRSVARAIDGATVNDAVLTVVAGGLWRWLEARHGRLRRVRVKVPVSLHGMSLTDHDAGAESGNRDSFFFVDLPLGPAAPLERLGEIRRATTVRKQGHDAQHIDAVMHELARVPQLREFAEQVLTHPRSFAFSVSNVPGPRHRVCVQGVSVCALHSLVEIRENHALRVAALSYANTLSLGLTVDPTLVVDVDDLAEDMRIEAAALIASVMSR